MLHGVYTLLMGSQITKIQISLLEKAKPSMKGNALHMPWRVWSLYFTLKILMLVYLVYISKSAWPACKLPLQQSRVKRGTKTTKIIFVRAQEGDLPTPKKEQTTKYERKEGCKQLPFSPHADSKGDERSYIFHKAKATKTPKQNNLKLFRTSLLLLKMNLFME